MEPTGNPENNIYYHKYLKYKAKYLELKAQLAGGPKMCKMACPKNSTAQHNFQDGQYTGNPGFLICTHCKCGKRN